MVTQALRAVLVWTLAGRSLICVRGTDLEKAVEDGLGKVNVALTLKVDDQPVLQRLFENLDKAMTVGDLRTALSSSRTWTPDTADATEDDTDSSKVRVAIVADATDEEVEDSVTLSALLDQQQQQQTGASTKEVATHDQVEQKEGEFFPLIKQGFLQSVFPIARTGEKDALKLTSIINSATSPFSKEFWRTAFSTFNFSRLADTVSQNGKSKVFKQLFCFCPLMKAPVCGFDGVTYNNLCLLECKHVKLKHAGSCKNEETELSGKLATPGECHCPLIDQPVCGTDGKTYANKCVLDCLGKTLAHDGKCPAEEGNPRSAASPGCTCPSTVEPVCGTNNKTYKNSCSMKCENVELKHSGFCTTDELCESCKCTKELAPVCGRDGNSYRNKCLLECEGMDFKHDGPCHSIEKNCDCTFEYNPVCAVDGLTYANECILRCSGVGLAHKGECAPGVAAPGAASCPLNDDPVCGIDGITYLNGCWASSKDVIIARKGKCETEGTVCNCPDTLALVCGVDGVTYKNRCQLDCANVRLAALGKCTDQLCRCSKKYDPVCGADRVTYRNPCYLRCNNARLAHKGACRQATPVSQSAARALSATREPPQDENECKCPTFYLPVCGQDGQTYNNMCELHCMDVEFAYSGECKPVDQPCKCPRTWEPVCATNGKTYPNICLLNYDDKVFKHDGECTKKERRKAFNEDHCVCPRILEVVCGADGQSYTSRCLMECAGTKFFHQGECEFQRVTRKSCALNTSGECEPEDQPCKCPRTWEPVCATNGKTYPNICLLNYDDKVFKHDGECTKTERRRAFDEDHCVCPRILEVVCGADGQTYANRCLMECAGTKFFHQGECTLQRATRELAALNTTQPCECPEVPAPVCGVDGKTYRNECELSCRRVALKHSGPCSDTKEPESLLRTAKLCVCPLVHEPLCGTDGKTYPNTCVAKCRNIEIKHPGECHESSVPKFGPDLDIRACKCRLTDPVCGADEKVYDNRCLLKRKGMDFLHYGYCSNLFEGKCAQALYKVCGTNNKTYANDCLRHKAGVLLKFRRPCTETDDDYVCSCPERENPVCGRDGRTYRNGCEMECREVELDHQGRCSCPCPRTLDPVCGSDDKTYNNECLLKCEGGVALRYFGRCAEGGDAANTCPKTAEPVCGTNGQTYANDCLRYRDGAILLERDLCRDVDTTQVVITVDNCYCQLATRLACGEDGKTYISGCVMECAGAELAHWGRCMPEPPTNLCPCPRILDPVCGRDGKTYNNECLMECEGITMRYFGRCVEGGEAINGCPETVDPVCGTNGKTYANDCLRYLDGIGLLKRDLCHAIDLTNVVVTVENCPCPTEVNLVCGEDGKTYVNECLMKCVDVKLARTGKCIPGTPSSLCPCPHILDPVCGSDGKTYNNKCLMECEGITMRYFGRCVEGGEAINGCPETVDPVCGTNGKTYANDCLRYLDGIGLLKRDLCHNTDLSKVVVTVQNCTCPTEMDLACGKSGNTYINECVMKCAGVELAHKGKCMPGTPSSLCDCPRILDPVCGSDGKTYNNKCLMECEGIIMRYFGRCVEGGEAEKACPDTVEPVCGTNGKTYANDCLRYRDRATLYERDFCRDKSSNKVVSMVQKCPCPLLTDLVCGRDGRTYINECVMRYAGVSLAYKGKCRTRGTPRPSEPRLCPCPRTLDPVCGSDGKTYNNKCVMECEGITLLHHGKCAAGGKTCPDITDPVCSTSGKTYQNDCARFLDGAVLKERSKCPRGTTVVSARDVFCECLAVTDTVCGRDGNTYISSCEMDCRQVKLNHTGKCLKPYSELHSAGDPYSACTLEYLPVCGENGVTYANKCLLEAQNVALKSEGPCQGFSHVAAVASADHPVCRCPRHYRPVCGVDGKTYPNACVRECHDVLQKHEGQCLGGKSQQPEPEPPVCRCPRHHKPVCGTDGKTYANSCLMECNKVALKHYGRCSDHAKEKMFPS